MINVNRLLFISHFHRKIIWSPFLYGFCFCITILIIICCLPRFPNRILFTNSEDIVKNLTGEGRKINYCLPNQHQHNFIDISIDNIPTDFEILKFNPHVCNGGRTPSHCQPLQHVAIIITYRNREKHLQLLLFRLHQFLYHQNIAYRIFVVEQADNKLFNKGLLYNIGVLESLKLNPNFDCFIFHDVDLLPEIVQNLYLCDQHLRQLSSAIDEYRYHVIFPNNGGGVIAISKSNFLKINGFPNRYWGWGAEDDEISARALLYNLYLTRPFESIGRYHSIRHLKTSLWSLDHHQLFKKFNKYLDDGFVNVNAVPNNFYGLSHQYLTQELRNHSLDSNSIYLRAWVNSVPNLNFCAREMISNYLKTDQSKFISVANFLNFHLLSTHLLVHVTLTKNSTYFMGNELLPRLSWFWFVKFYGWF